MSTDYLIRIASRIAIALADIVPRDVKIGQFEFVEWTADNHLRHSTFIALRDDKAARDVGREEPA